MCNGLILVDAPALGRSLSVTLKQRNRWMPFGAAMFRESSEAVLRSGSRLRWNHTRRRSRQQDYDNGRGERDHDVRELLVGERARLQIALDAARGVSEPG